MCHPLVYLNTSFFCLGNLGIVYLSSYVTFAATCYFPWILFDPAGQFTNCTTVQNVISAEFPISAENPHGFYQLGVSQASMLVSLLLFLLVTRGHQDTQEGDGVSSSYGEVSHRQLGGSSTCKSPEDSGFWSTP